MTKQFYNVSDSTGKVHKVLVSRSVQYDPYERHLTISKAAARKFSKLPGPFHCESPTPYHPVAIFSTTD